MIISQWRLNRVDNASTLGLGYLDDARSIPRVTVKSNSHNLGIAAALHQGAEWALASSYDWLATFDQDSRLPGGYTQGLFRGLARYPSATEVGVVVPLVVYPWSLWPTSTSPSERERQAPRQEVRRVTGGITSGSMVRSSLLAKERWREDYFIDLVDYEFCLRACLQGYQTVEVGSVALFHQTAVLMSRETGPSAYSPDRYYYTVRNSLDMIRRYARNYPNLMGHTLYSLAANYIKPHIRLPFHDRNRQCLTAMVSGAKDALRSVGGPRPH